MYKDLFTKYGWKSTSPIEMHTTKPANPVDGDTYYDKIHNRMYTYDEKSSTWLMYQLYQDFKDKNIIRRNKIKNLLK